MISDRSRYSYRRDPSVPDFSAGEVMTVMDAHCSLCAKGAAWIARHDTRQEFTIIPMQSEIGSALMHHYGLDPSDPVSWLYIEDGYAYSSLDAVIRAGRRLGGIWNGLLFLRILPSSVRDMLYRWVARNRYQWFGRNAMCDLLDPQVQKRLLR